MDKCLGCDKELPANIVQQAGMHIGCAGKLIDVYQIKIEGVGNGPTLLEIGPVLEEVRLHYSEGGGESITISKKKMTQLAYHSLSEFMGY